MNCNHIHSYMYSDAFIRSQSMLQCRESVFTAYHFDSKTISLLPWLSSSTQNDTEKCLCTPFAEGWSEMKSISCSRYIIHEDDELITTICVVRIYVYWDTNNRHHDHDSNSTNFTISFYNIFSLFYPFSLSSFILTQLKAFIQSNCFCFHSFCSTLFCLLNYSYGNLLLIV